jgi:hypothetical protein
MPRKQDRQQDRETAMAMRVNLRVHVARQMLHDAIDGMDVDDLAAAVSELGEYYGEYVTVVMADGVESGLFRKGVAQDARKGGE